MPARPDTEKRRKRIQRLWRQGHTHAEIGKRLGLDPARVGSEIAKMRQAGWDVPRRSTVDPGLVALRRERIQELWPTGATYAEIGARLGITRSAVKSLVRRMRADGIDLPRRREARDVEAPQRDRILTLWAGGATLPEIAAELSTTTAHVGSEIAWARKIGEGAERRVANGERERRAAEITRLYRDGLPLAEIASKVGVTPGSVATILSRVRAEGVDLPRRQDTQAGSEGQP